MRDYKIPEWLLFIILLLALLLHPSMVSSQTLSYDVKVDYENNEIARVNRLSKIEKLYSHIPMNPEHVYYLIEFSFQSGIDPDLILAIIWCESNFDPNAKNKASSATGYSQMIKSTAIYCNDKIDLVDNYNHKVHAKNPYINITLMISYIKDLMERYNWNADKVLISYRGRNDVNYVRLVKKRMIFIKSNKYKL